MHSVLLALITLLSTITWVDRNGRPMNRGYNRNRQRERSKPKKMSVHRLEDDSVTQRSKEMQKSRGYVSSEDQNAAAEAKTRSQPRSKPKSIEGDLPEASVCPGLFGVKLGDVFDPGSAEPISDDEYSFVPKEKFRSYDRYSVRILPHSKRVYEIRAKSESTLDSAELDVVLALLEKKFNTVARGRSLRFRGEKGMSDGRTVTVSSSGIVTVDLALRGQVKAERRMAAEESASASLDDIRAL